MSDMSKMFKCVLRFIAHSRSEDRQSTHLTIGLFLNCVVDLVDRDVPSKIAICDFLLIDDPVIRHEIASRQNVDEWSVGQVETVLRQHVEAVHVSYRKDKEIRHSYQTERYRHNWILAIEVVLTIDGQLQRRSSEVRMTWDELPAIIRRRYLCNDETVIVYRLAERREIATPEEEA